MSSENQIFRYKFSEEFIDQLLPFAKIYQYSDRITYKEEWKRWLENNDTFINQECNRLEKLGYKGNIIDKMYKSGRYYFRNKTQHTIKKRRQYVSLAGEIIINMDTHINNNHNIKPSISYIHFCEDYSFQLNRENTRLLSEGLNTQYIKDKFKDI